MLLPIGYYYHYIIPLSRGVVGRRRRAMMQQTVQQEVASSYAREDSVRRKTPLVGGFMVPESEEPNGELADLCGRALLGFLVRGRHHHLLGASAQEAIATRERN